ncbi:MAG: FprA family A-type flavoprotein [Endomicrobiia bacterium]
MPLEKIKENIFFIGTIDWDRRLFDELIPLPDGTSYNSYLIKGSTKTVLIDSSDPTKETEFFENLKNSGIKTIDYIIPNHAEQDHSGAITKLLELHPETKVVTNIKCKDMLKDLLLIPEEKFVVVNDYETLSLGDKTLQFFLTPWVHWPETMVTYLKEDKILFSCDFFGSHLATSDLFVTNETKVYESAKRYYAEIMMPFRIPIRKNMEIVKKLDIDMIAPSHGPIYNKPKFILDAYSDWISDSVKNEVILPYISMHGSTQKIVDYFVNELINLGITVKPFNITKTDIGELAISLVDAATIVLGTPTVLAGPHPVVAYVTILTNALRPKTKFVSIIGSYGWGTKVVEQLSSMLSNLKTEILQPVVIKGYPKEQDFVSLKNLATQILQKHKEIKII